jgi:ubiquinone/menaquinone biosynthesis C-methylase UbiE
VIREKTKVERKYTPKNVPTELTLVERLEREKLGPNAAADIAHDIQTQDDPVAVLVSLLRQLPASSYTYDWNMGSVLRYFSPDNLVDALSMVEFPARLYDSVGLTWAIGIYRNQNPKLIAFLENAVRESRYSEAWWQAAFSLQALGRGQAINLLRRSIKKSSVKSLDYYLSTMSSKESIIGVLVQSTGQNIAAQIHPRLKEILLTSTDKTELGNACWLIGRLNLLDTEIISRVKDLTQDTDRELRHYAFRCIEQTGNAQFKDLLLDALTDPDSMVRRIAIAALVAVADKRSLVGRLEEALDQEKNDRVVAQLSEAIYQLSNPQAQTIRRRIAKAPKNENGLICDESDKWYQDASIYNYFSEAEDPEDVAFNLVRRELKNRNIVIRNPIDIATGTGRTLRSIIKDLDFEGTLYGVDMSREMCDYVERDIRRERRYSRPLRIVESSIAELPQNLDTKSTFIISSFGFPSKFTRPAVCIAELKAVHEMLEDGGVLCTIGWDETFNDELNMLWYQYIPDDIEAKDFEEWRRKRAAVFASPRNCKLSWLKTNLRVPLQFTSVEEATNVMGHLFGRDAGIDIAKSGRLSWDMAYGITFNTKEEIGNILQELEAWQEK